MLGFPNEETALFIPNLKDFMLWDLESMDFLCYIKKSELYFSENVKHCSFISPY